MSDDAKVLTLWRYPVKSMMGEELNSAEFTASGMIGDRGRALIDRATGRVVSAKNPKRWPTMFRFRASYIDSPRANEPLPPVKITLPDGVEIRSDDANAEAVLSKALGVDVALQTSVDVPRLEEYRPVVDGIRDEDSVSDELIRAGTFFDAAPVHVLSTSTFEALRAAYPQGRFEARRFRPNIIIGNGGAGFVENAWHNGLLSIGSQVRLKVDSGCPRCVMTTLPQGDLPQDLGILRTAAQSNKAIVGIYCSVAATGTVRSGDLVAVELPAAAR